eukprot:7009701-Prymnesium_polylepis.1
MPPAAPPPPVVPPPPVIPPNRPPVPLLPPSRPPHPPSSPARFSVIGQCQVVGDCVRSPQYPFFYPDDLGCTIIGVPPIPIIVTEFDVDTPGLAGITCAEDFLSVDHVNFCGSTGPAGRVGAVLAPASSF